VAQPARDEQRLPPGQTLSRSWPVLHYGPVPRFRPETWDLRVFGATAAGAPTTWRYADLCALPRTEVVADLHCVTKFSILGMAWGGIPASTLLELVPPAPDTTHVLVWAEYGYSANLPLADLADPATMLATHVDGAPLSPEHGWPLRFVVPRRYGWKGPKWVRGIEYLVGDRRGFWEERGYHNGADPWREERYSYQEDDGSD